MAAWWVEDVKNDEVNGDPRGIQVGAVGTG